MSENALVGTALSDVDMADTRSSIDEKTSSIVKKIEESLSAADKETSQTTELANGATSAKRSVQLLIQ